VDDGDQRQDFPGFGKLDAHYGKDPRKHHRAVARSGGGVLGAGRRHRVRGDGPHWVDDASLPCARRPAGDRPSRRMIVAKIGLRVDGVSKRYTHRVKGEHYAAREVRIDVAPGEFLTLLGPSGCGKTTTLRIIAGFEQPDAGRIYFGEQDVTGLSANRRDIGFVFQNYALFPHLSVAENVGYGLAVRGQSQGSAAKSVG